MLTTLLPRKLAASRWRGLWLALLLLAPLAYATGAWLYVKHNENARAHLTLDRAQAFAKAIAYLSTKGVNVTGWQRYLHLEPNDDLRFYYSFSADRARAAQFVSPLTLKLLFRKADGSQIADVWLGPDGSPLGFRQTLWQAEKESALPPDDARRLAEERLHARPEAAFANFAAEPKVSETTDKGALTRSYVWEWQVPALTELNARTTITVFGNRVIGEEIETKLDAKYARRVLHADQPLKLTSNILYGLALTLAAVFGVVRFIKRARQKELSFARISFITFFLAIAFNLVIVLTDAAFYSVARLPFALPSWSIYVSTGLVWLAGGLFVGIAYGSGEGDIREAYPGKLTSIDALLLGKLLSRNVGRGFLWGAALGGWLFLGLQLNSLLWRGPNTGPGYMPFWMYYGHLPLVLILTHWQTEVILLTVVGLLLPLPFLRRQFLSAGRLARLGQYLPAHWQASWSQSAVFVLLTPFVWLVAQGPFTGFHPYAGVLLVSAFKTLVLLVAFFNFDMLTAGVALGLPLYTQLALAAWAQPATTIHRAGAAALFSALGILLVEFVCAVRGRWFRDEEVRPLYASNLAERLSLQAEVSAARVAQERLLPQRLPASPNFTVAAACVPAREVGGDFYDFFEVGPHQIGMLVAEGGGRGLGSALSIAYAKGFLMSKIGAQTRGDDSPTEVLRGLQERLAQMLTHDDAIGLAYLVLDTDDGVLRYARTGTYPQVLLGRADAVMPVTETELKFSTRNPDTPPIQLIEGRAEVEPGDHLIVFTGGLAEVWQNNQQAPAHEFSQLVAQATHTNELQTALDGSVSRCLKLVRKQELSDDLTAVVVRIERVGAESVLSAAGSVPATERI